MTVQATDDLRKDYGGNGSTQDFPVTFRFLADTHLAVILTENSTTPPTKTTLVLGTDYTVTGAGGSGGSVHTAVAPTATQSLSILPDPPLSQLTHYVEGDPFPALSHENALDLLTIIARKQQEALNRSIKMDSEVTDVDVTMPTYEAGKLLAWGPSKKLVNVGSGAAEQLVDLFSSSDATKGAGMVGYDPTLAYGPDTVGGALNSTNGVAAVTMTSTNVTLTPLQYGRPVIVLSGTLTANLNLIFPNLARQWTVVNNCIGPFTVTAKTAAGRGVVVTAGCTRNIWSDGTNFAAAMNEVETPAQFNSSTRVANMAAVQRALGNLRTLNVFSASQVLTALHLGAMNEFSSSSDITCTIPTTTSFHNPGVCYWIMNTGTGTLTVNRSGSDIFENGNSSLTSITMKQGDTLLLCSNGSTKWSVLGGSTQMRISNMFSSSLAASGYQRLPSGLIIQWGRLAVGDSPGNDYFGNISFPIAFPNQIFQVNATLYSYAGNNFDASIGVTSHSLTGFGFTTQEWTALTQNLDVVYIAIGY